MAIPTDFKGYTPNATVTKSFKILGTATVGVWGNDVDGTFTPAILPLAPNMVVFMGAVYTDAQIVAAMQDYIARAGKSHDGAGGYVAETGKQAALTSTTCT